MEEKSTEEVSLGMEVGIASSMLGEKTSWKFVETDTVLRADVVFIGNTEWIVNAISTSVVDKVGAT